MTDRHAGGDEADIAVSTDLHGMVRLTFYRDLAPLFATALWPDKADELADALRAHAAEARQQEPKR